MPRLVRVITPENAEIEYELAGIASRAAAAVLDMLLVGGAVALLMLAKYELDSVVRWRLGVWAGAVLWIAVFVIFFGYFLAFETAWNGQSPGKRAARLRVVRQGGLPVDLPCAAVRNLVRVIDVIPYVVPYLVGGLCVMFSGENKRLGDLAAGTMVVKERARKQTDPQPVAPPQTVGEAGSAQVPNVELVTREEFEAVRRFLDRRPELRPELRERIAAKIAEPLIRRLGIDEGYVKDCSSLLEDIHRACVEQRGMR